MAGVFASMAVKWALDKLASFLPAAASSSSTPVTTASQDVELLRRLERTMRRIRATLHDAEEHWNIREEFAKLRLKELKELAYAAEDVVEEYENEVDRCHLEAAAATVSNNKRKRQEENETYSSAAGMVAVPMELVVRARKIIDRIDEMKEYSDNFTLSENDGERRYAPDISTLRKTSSVVYEKSIIGREEDKNKIVETLISIEANNVACPVSVLAIVGMGGLGKTTLAQLVYNDPRVRQSFDVFAWVCVSEQFDVSTITKSIISAIKKDRCDLSELADLQEKLVHEVQDKRVLLVLDDVWNERSDQWESLLVPMSKTRICNIIVTTRNEAVAKLVQTTNFYRIKGLSSEDSWSLFKQIAFAANQDNGTSKNLEEIGKYIVDKCKGLPLAIKTLGSILRCETDEVRWRDVLESKLWDLEESRSGVLPALELSYKHMSIYLKRCFVALSLFPKDYDFEKSHVVKLWKSLDLLQCDRDRKEDDTGTIYFNELVQRSLLEVYSNWIDRDTYVMHDLIHDLACFLGGEEFFRFEGDTSIEIPPTVRYISASKHGAFVKNLAASHSIKAIIILDGGELQGELPLNCKKLRAVKHIEHHYNMILPCGIGCGINIHTLPAVKISRCGCSCIGNIRDFRSLNKIRELSLHGLGNVACVEDAKGAQLQSKKHLRSLELTFDSEMYHCKNTPQGEDAVTVSHKQLLESLQPHHVLRELVIRYYGSQRFPNASFSNLTEVFLYGCHSRHLPTLGELPSLKSLKVEAMNQVKYIGREFCSHFTPGVQGFPSLTCLTFSLFPELLEWSEVDVGDFPCLQTLVISHATELRSLLPVSFMSLVNLRLYNCEELAAVPESATLRELLLVHCPRLRAVSSLRSLTTLHIEGRFDDEEILYKLLNCHSSLECITFKCKTTRRITLQPRSLPSLTKLRLRCWMLKYCDGLAGITTLQELDVSGCPNLPIHSLPPSVNYSLYTVQTECSEFLVSR